MKRISIKRLYILLSVLICLAIGGSVSAISLIGSGIPAAASPTYILSEDFDSSSVCYSGDETYVNCENTWVVADTTAVNFQASGLDGVYGCDIDANGSDYDTIDIAITDTNPVYGYFIVNYDTFSLSTDRTLFQINGNNGGVIVLSFKCAWNETPKLVLGGGQDVDATALSAATTYHVWWEYAKQTGEGGNAVGRIWISENSTKPETPTVEVTDGNSAFDADYLMFLSFDGQMDGIYDKIRVDDEQIGSSPE